MPLEQNDILNAFSGETQVAIQMWDIGGQSIGSKMIDNYLCGAQAVLLCYDITNNESFANLEDWHRLVCQAFENGPMPFVGLVANKCVFPQSFHIAYNIRRPKSFAHSEKRHS